MNIKKKIVSLALSASLALSSLGGLGAVCAATVAQRTPYRNDFSKQGFTLTEANGWTVTGLANGASVQVKDGAVAVSGIPKIDNGDGTTKNGLVQDQFAELSLTPINEGVLVVEADLCVTDTTRVNTNFNATKGLINVLDSKGNKVANTYLSGRGATRVTSAGTACDVTSTWSGTARSWGHEAQTYGIKYEIDFAARKWRGYRASGGSNGTYAQYTTSDGVNEFSFASADAENVAKVQFLMGVNGMSVDNIKIYSVVQAAQTAKNYNMSIGDTLIAGIKYTPTSSSMNDMTWTSSNEKVATVNNNGLITALSSGTSTISAKSEFYGVNFSYTVNVDSAEAVKQTIPYNNTFADTSKFPSGYRPMKKDGFATVAMTDGAYIESDGSRLVMHGSTANKNTGMGRLTLEFEPITTGNYVVELKYGNINGEVGNVSASDGLFGVYSSNGTRAADMYVIGRGPNYSRMWSKGAWLTSVVNNSNWIGGGVIRYEIDFTKKTYKAYQNGKLLTDLTTGNTDFEFSANDISKIVFTFTNDGDYVDDIRICKNIAATQKLYGYKMSPNDKVAMTAQGLIISAGSVRDFTFKSDNTEVAAVAANGRITAKGYGSALITVVNEENNIRFVYAVNVDEQTDKITVDQQDRVLYTGEAFRLTYSVPKYHTAGEVVWSSSDTSVATVGKDGTVIGKSAGTAVITATSEYGACADCVIKVVDFDTDKSAISLKNDGFEQGSLRNWTSHIYSDGKKPEWSSGGVNNSVGCAKLTGHSYITQVFDNPEQDARYTLSYMMKIDSLDSGSYAHMEIESKGYDNIVSNTFPMLTDGWERVCVDFVVPKGCDAPAILLRLNGNGTVYYDDVKITRQKDITEVRMFSDGLALNSIVKNAPLTTVDVHYVPNTSGNSELVAAFYEDGEFKKLAKKTVSGNNRSISDLIDADDLNENTTVGIMNWNSLSGMNALGIKATFLEKTQRSDAYSFFETNRMRGVYGSISEIYKEDTKKLITDSGINTLILNIIGTFYGSDVSKDMSALHKVLDDAEALANETGVKIIPKISFGANGTVANVAYGEFHSGSILVDKNGETVERSNLPCPRAREYWKKQVTDVLSVVASHKKLVGGVVDLEMYSGMNTSYGATCKCDNCAADFDSVYGTKVAEQTITARNQYLLDNGLKNKYDQWHKAEIISITSEVRDVLHSYNPDFIIGYMPFIEWIDGITEGLGTKQMPVMIFSEGEYTGDLSKIYINRARIKNNDLPAVYATGLWSTKNTGGNAYIAPEDFAAKAVEGMENSMGYWIYSSSYLLGDGNSAEDNAAYISAIESANNTIDTKYGLR